MVGTRGEVDPAAKLPIIAKRPGLLAAGQRELCFVFQALGKKKTWCFFKFQVDCVCFLCWAFLEKV